MNIFIFTPHHFFLRICKSLLLIGLVSLCILKSYASETIESIGIRMVKIPSGTFVMGACVKSKLTDVDSKENAKRVFMGETPMHHLNEKCISGSPDQDASAEETPQHLVSVRSFLMSETKITLGQFKKFIKVKGRTDLLTEGFMHWDNTYGDNAPVHGVSWIDAQDFISWLNEIDGGGFRLPSEAEWEYACRSGKHQIYCGSDNPNEVAWHQNNSRGVRKNVAMLKPNSFGLFDMSGNEWEWVQDCWHENYLRAPEDGTAWTDNCLYDGARVTRGGSFHNPLKLIRASSRGWSLSQHKSIGFRVAKDRN